MWWGMDLQKGNELKETTPSGGEKQPDAGMKKGMLPTASYDKDEDWVKEHIEQFGTEPSFF